MKLKAGRLIHSLLFRSLVTFFAVLALVVFPIVYAYLKDIERALGDKLSSQLELIARHGLTTLDADQIILLNNPFWKGTLEHKNVVRALSDI